MTRSQLRGDHFRSAAEVAEPDPRTRLFWAKSPLGTPGSDAEFESFHDHIARFELAAHVPEPVRVAWDAARNLLLYAWFVYRFNDLAHIQAARAVELSLRARMGLQAAAKAPSLRRLLGQAIDSGLLCADHLESWSTASQRLAEKNAQNKLALENPTAGISAEAARRMFAEMKLPLPQVYLARVCDRIAQLRNTLAHGTESMAGRLRGVVEDMRDIINAVMTSAQPTDERAG